MSLNFVRRKTFFDRYIRDRDWSIFEQLTNQDCRSLDQKRFAENVFDNYLISKTVANSKISLISYKVSEMPSLVLQLSSVN